MQRTLLKVTLILQLMLVSTTKAGPIIVGNGSGLSEFNITLFQRQIVYAVDLCRHDSSCSLSLTTPQWTALLASVIWLKTADLRFEDEAGLPGRRYRIDISAKTLFLNRTRLWLTLPTGELIGMDFAQAADFVIGILEAEFSLDQLSMSTLRARLMQILASQVSQYDVTIDNDERLAVTNIGNGVAGLAVISQGKTATSIELFDMANYGRCLDSKGELAPPKQILISHLDFAFYTGPQPVTAEMEMNLHGDIRYACRTATESWAESAHLRLAVNLQYGGTGYSIARSQSRVRFESIQKE